LCVDVLHVPDNAIGADEVAQPRLALDDRPITKVAAIAPYEIERLGVLR
jgi:hypothetical protein